MAHMVRYSTTEGDRFAPTVSNPVSAQVHGSPADVMLVSALLNMYYAGGQLPPGARHLIKPSGTFTAQTTLFIKDFQRKFPSRRQDGVVSVLPIGNTSDQLVEYTIFRLYRMVVLFAENDNDTVLEALKSLPHLHDLDKKVQGSLHEVNPEVPENQPPSGEVGGPSGWSGSAEGLRGA